MTAGRWQEIERIYQSVLDRDPDQRSAFLIEACAGDDDLRSKVESLLATRTGKDSLIDNGGVAAAARLVPEPPQDLTGRKLGRYEVIRKLGSGGMGEVYLASDTRLGREVALKVLRPGSIDHTDRNRLEREAKAASALRHPNIVTVHDFDSCDGVDFIVMEYVPGRMLSELIGKKGLPVREALGHAAQIADALIAAHAAGIIHRDLKPANVIVDDSGTVKVLDFGLAKRAAGLITKETQSLSGGFVAGTAAYMSPEQAEGKPLDARTDIFSFGAVLYELLAGARAFERDSTASTIAAIMTEEPPSVKNVPPELDRIVQRCLRKDPSRRFQTMADVKAALEDALVETQNKSGAHAKRRWITVGGAVLAVAVVASALWVYVSGHQRPSPRLVPLTSYPGFARSPDFSPDGTQVAFAWNGEKQDNFDIYVKFIDAPTPLRLTNSPDLDDHPAWSPDARTIAFVRTTRNGPKLMLVPALGGQEQMLADVEGISKIAWSPDGESIVISARNSAGTIALFRYHLATGGQTQLTFPAAQSLGDSNPSFSLDGRSLVFARFPDLRSIELLALPVSRDARGAGEPRHVTTVVSPDGNREFEAVWTRDGKELVFTGLFRVDAFRPAQPKPVDPAGDAINPAIAPQRDRLALVKKRGDVNIWSVDLTEGKPVGTPVPLFASAASEDNAQYSPDERSIVFSCRHPDSSDLCIANADGTNVVPVMSAAAAKGSSQGRLFSDGTPRWSPDGQRLAFDREEAGKWDIYTISRAGGPVHRITYEKSMDVVPSYSRDGRWIYFSSDRTGRFEVWKAPVAGGAAVQMTRNGGFVAFESLDGRYLYYTKHPSLEEESPLWRMDAIGGEETELIHSVSRRAFGVIGTGIYFVTQSPPGRFTLMFYSFKEGTARNILDLPSHPHQGVTATNDGRRVVWSQHDLNGSDLFMLEGFR